MSLAEDIERFYARFNKPVIKKIMMNAKDQKRFLEFVEVTLDKVDGLFAGGVELVTNNWLPSNIIAWLDSNDHLFILDTRSGLVRNLGHNNLLIASPYASQVQRNSDHQSWSETDQQGTTPAPEEQNPRGGGDQGRGEWPDPSDQCPPET